MLKRIVSLILVLSLMASMGVTAALAADEVEAVQDGNFVDDPQELEQAVEAAMIAFFGVENDVSSMQEIAATTADYTERTSSDQLIAFLKAHEGFSKYPMWDNSQWSVGYGSRCPDDKLEEYRKNGITEAEAEQLLRSILSSSSEPTVNNLAKKYNISLSQIQFDALVDFTYALGPSWSSGSRLLTSLNGGDYSGKWTAQNATKNPGWTFLNAVGTWCLVNGAPYHATATLRIRELEIFCNGNYIDNYDSVKGTSDEHFTYLFFNANGGTCARTSAFPSGWSVTNCYYFTGSPYENLLTATWPGHTFSGWYTEPVGGTRITAETIASSSMAGKYFAGMTVYAHWDGGYSDVPDNAWYADAVTQATKDGLFDGYADGTFRPNEPLSRAMFVTVLWRLAGKPKASKISTFSDVERGRWYTAAVDWGTEQGIVQGVGNGRFNPNGTVTREQAAVFFHRYYGKESAALSVLDTFPDANQVSDYAKKDMAWAIQAKLINGSKSNGTLYLHPKKGTTRAEVAQMFLNFKKNVMK